MSFKFGFSIDNDDGNIAAPSSTTTVDSDSRHGTNIYTAKFDIVPLTIPAVSSIVVDAIYYKKRRLWKRQIDDVQFQLAQLDSMDEKKESVMLQAISNDNNASDVIKGVYEGGLKTWECSIDLLGYIVDNFEGLSAHLHGRRVLEIGCGTALPSLHILKSVPGVSVTMQDYNKDVLELITIPNVLCNTILEPSGDSTLGDKSHVDGDMETCEIHVDSRRMQMLFGKDADKIIGERDIPQLTDLEVQEADRKLLSRPSLATQCEFIGGGWEEMEKEMCRLGRQHTFDLIVTSETIYETSTYKQLHDLLACMLAKPGADDSIDGCSWPMVLVAAKSLYFGLTGSVLSFSQYVASQGVFDVEPVWQSGGSMNREILRLTWKAAVQ